MAPGVLAQFFAAPLLAFAYLVASEVNHGALLGDKQSLFERRHAVSFAYVFWAVLKEGKALIKAFLSFGPDSAYAFAKEKYERGEVKKMRSVVFIAALLLLIGSCWAEPTKIPKEDEKILVDVAFQLVRSMNGWLASEEWNFRVYDYKVSEYKKRVTLDMEFRDENDKFGPSAKVVLEVDDYWSARRFLSYEYDDKVTELDVAVPNRMKIDDSLKSTLYEDCERLAKVMNPQLAASDLHIKLASKSCNLDLTRSDKRIAIVRLEYHVSRSEFGTAYGVESEILVGLPPDFKPTTFLSHNGQGLSIATTEKLSLAKRQEERAIKAAKVFVEAREPDFGKSHWHPKEVSVTLDLNKGNGHVVTVSIRYYGENSTHILKDNDDYQDRTVRIGLDEHYQPRVYLQYEGQWVSEPPFIVPASIIFDK